VLEAQLVPIFTFLNTMIAKPKMFLLSEGFVLNLNKRFFMIVIKLCQWNHVPKWGIITVTTSDPLTQFYITI
jgi:hypothetical protein